MDDENRAFRLTVKGKLMAEVGRYGLGKAVGEDIWNNLQGFCMQILRADHPDAEFAAVVFDGHGGAVVGVDRHDEKWTNEGEKE